MKNMQWENIQNVRVEQVQPMRDTFYASIMSLGFANVAVNSFSFRGWFLGAVVIGHHIVIRNAYL